MSGALTGIDDPVHDLRANDSLFAAHISTLGMQPARRRGDVDQELAVARIKIEDADSMTEAVGYLSSQEIYAVLGDPKLLTALMTMPVGTTDVCAVDQARQG